MSPKVARGLEVRVTSKMQGFSVPGKGCIMLGNGVTLDLSCLRVASQNKQDTISKDPTDIIVDTDECPR